MKRLLLFSAVALVLLWTIREVIYIGVRKNTTGEFGKLRHAFIENNAHDILIIGSSRAESHFHSGIIADSTGLSVYNIGMTGATLPFVETSLLAYLEKSKTPKYVILNIDYHVLHDPVDSIHHFPRYFPYIGENKKLYAGLSKHDGRFPYFRYLAPYSMPYFGNRYLNVAIRGYLHKPGKYDSTYVNGWSPTEPSATPVDDFDFAPYNSEGPEEVWESLERIKNICEKNKSMLVIVLSPLYEKQSNAIVNEMEIKKRISDFSAKSNCPLLDYSRDPMCNDATLFADPAHLNKTGSMAFSRLFASKLKKMLQ